MLHSSASNGDRYHLDFFFKTVGCADLANARLTAPLRIGTLGASLGKPQVVLARVDSATHRMNLMSQPPPNPIGLQTLPPQSTPFVGRGQELAEIADLLCNPECRLLTLVGPGVSANAALTTCG